MQNVKRVYSFLFVISCFIFFSCFMNKGKSSLGLHGKIAVAVEDTFYIYDDAKTNVMKFKITDEPNVKYSGFRWINKSDNFIGVEYLKTDTTGINQGNVVCFDLNGKIIRRIYEAQENEIAGYTFLSRNDKQLLITVVKKGDITNNPLAGLNRETSILILDFGKGEIIKKIENVGTSLTIGLNESPWLYDENRFIYSMSGERGIMLDGAEINSIDKNKFGIYIYDVVNDQTTLLVPDARLGISSPFDNSIAYLKSQKLYVMSLNDNLTKEVYEAKSGDKITNIHWTPDGKQIYLAYYSPELDSAVEKLIEIKTGKEMPFNKIGFGFNPYTWK